MIHHLKIDAAPLDALLSSAKTGEVRRDDRGFAVGHTVRLTCADGREAERRITHIQRGYGLPDGICALSYAPVGAAGQDKAEVERLREEVERLTISEDVSRASIDTLKRTYNQLFEAMQAEQGNHKKTKAERDALRAQVEAMREAGHNLRVFVSLFSGGDEVLILALKEWDAALSTPAAAAHPDDAAVDRFASAMKAKLAKKREDGRGGWSGPDCSAPILSQMLREHVEKGDPIDVANFAMMLHQRGEQIESPLPNADKGEV